MTALMRRCFQGPDEHLAAPTLSPFEAYHFGYQTVTSLEFEEFDRDAFTAAVMADYKVQGAWPYNVSTKNFLVAAEGESRALSKYLNYWTRLAKPGGERHKVQPLDDFRVDLFVFLSTEDGIRKRPGLYLGANDAAASHIWSMISGCRWAEIDVTGQPGKAGAFLIQFQSWVEQRFPFSTGIPWHRTFYCVSCSSAAWGLKTFFNHFDHIQNP